MSKFNWRNGFAIGLMLGIGLTAIVLVWGQLVYDFADCIAKGECERYATPYEGDNEPKGLSPLFRRIYMLRRQS
jgi:hypothetical protein